MARLQQKKDVAYGIIVSKTRIKSVRDDLGEYSLSSQAHRKNPEAPDGVTYNQID